MNSLTSKIEEMGASAACVLTCVGSLTHCDMRFANRKEFTTLEGGPFEICSLVGTLHIGGYHLHMSVADGDGRMFGGHVSAGCIIYTTAECVLGILSDVQFDREHCDLSGFEELVVKSRS